jgi:mono/diheme cytochrome c family protein
MRVATLIAVTGMLAIACSEEGTKASPSTASKGGAATPAPTSDSDSSPEPADLVSDGKQAYLSSCIACHNADPKLDGALGPSVAGASEPLLRARILYGEYPEGYQPKRQTRSMVPMPFLEKQIPAIAAYLASL